MNTPRPVSRFFGWVRTRTEPDVPDAADMGTAFGLDMCQPDPDELPPLPEGATRKTQGDASGRRN